MINICEEVDGCRYCSNLQKVIDRLGGEKILRLEYESDYQGYVDIDVLLSDGTVMSYYYSYGSCSGCDSWEAEDLDDAGIESAMLQEMTFFSNIHEYNLWCEDVKNNSNNS